MAGVTYDTGALLAAERRDQRLWVIHAELLEREIVPTVPAPVLAEAWRGGTRQALLSRLLSSCEVEPLTEEQSRRVGELAGRARHDDIVDVAVVEGALRRGDGVVTADEADLRRIADAAGAVLVFESVQREAAIPLSHFAPAPRWKHQTRVVGAREGAERRHRTLVWRKENGYGVEIAEVELGADRLNARGVAVGWTPVPQRLDYTLETAAAWVTTRLSVATRGQGWRRSLDLRRSADGVWSIEAGGEGGPELAPAGGEVAGLAQALDCDLGLSPLTNTMPALRNDLLHSDGSVDFVMAWVSVPDLSVRASRQRYTRVGDSDSGHQIEYRSLDSDFVSVLTFDADGLVIDYPQLATSVPSPREG